MRFLQTVSELSFRDKVRISDIQRELSIELLLLGVKRSQLRWLLHVIRVASAMPSPSGILGMLKVPY